MASAKVSQKQDVELTLGQRLAAARERKGLELEKAAHDTRMRPQRLRELEADDYSRCPHPSYARMFLKDYAKYLGIPLAEIKDQLPEAGESGAGGYTYIDELSDDSVPVPQMRRLRPRRRLMPVLVAGVSAILVAVVGLNTLIWFRKLDSLNLGKAEETAVEIKTQVEVNRAAEVKPEETPASTRPATDVAEDVALLNETISQTQAATEETFAPVPATLAAPAPAPASTPDDRAAFFVGSGLDPDGRVH
jgi:cytoskeleton protein RodZ